MKRIVLALAGLALLSSCSDVRDRRAPVNDQLTRPLEVARVDTSQPLSPVEHQPPKPPEPVAMPKPRKAKRPAPKPAPPAAAPAEDSTARGYAPEPATDSAPTPIDTVRPAPDSSPTPRDTAAVKAAAPAPVSDTVASRARDSAPLPDTTYTVARDTSAATSGVTGSANATGARTLPIGTEIHAALDDSINSRTDTVGRVVTAVVTENVTGSDGRTLIAAGAPVHLTVTRLSAAKSKSAQGRLALRVDDIGIGGQPQTVSADVQAVPHELRGRGVGTGEAAKVGVGAAGGAVLGRVLGGNTKGAVIGGVVGAAGGAVVASQTASRDVVVKARTPVTFVLTQPLVAP
jgi:hypothetical protein